MKPASVHSVQWPDGSTAALPPARLANASLADQLDDTGRPLNTRCGHHGLCSGCAVQLVAGSFVGRDGSITVAPAEIKACQGHLAAGAAATIAVPARSLAAHPPQVVTVFKAGVPAANAPLVPVVPGVNDHGLAIDIGTTTVVVALVDLRDGRIVREESSLNRQIKLGDNVVTRIQVAGRPGQLAALREAIGTTLAPLIAGVCAGAGVPPDRLAGATVAGNTTMLHLLTGTDPTAMGIAPFRAAFLNHRELGAAALGLDGPPTMPVHLLPGISAYVGADLVAGAICTGLHQSDDTVMLVDIGTNGEILLRHRGRIYATATAAGPAFEGGRLARGMRAAAGAVAHVRFADGAFCPELDVIPPAGSVIGLCGSAYVDFLAQGRRIALLRENGRITEAAWSALPDAHRHLDESLRGVRLRARDEATLVTEADIAQLLQAKAAIAAGIVILLRRAGLAPADVQTLHLAGGFGLHLDVSHAIASGLLPGFRPEQIDVVGNTALGGAWLALIDRAWLPEMTAVAAAAEVVELNLEPDFEDTFIDHLALP